MSGFDDLQRELISMRKRIEELERVRLIQNLRLPANGAFSPPIVTSDPASPVDGDIWYRSDLDEWKGRKNGTTVTFTVA